MQDDKTDRKVDVDDVSVESRRAHGQLSSPFWVSQHP